MTWRMPSSGWHCSPAPALYGGALAFLAQHTLDTTAFSVLPKGVQYASLDLKIQFLRPVLPETGDLTARGNLIHSGRNILVGRVAIVNAEGKSVALATGSLLVAADAGRRAEVKAWRETHPED